MYNFKSFRTIYGMVNFLNENRIKKENIIKITSSDYIYKYSLIYYEERA